MSIKNGAGEAGANSLKGFFSEGIEPIGSLLFLSPFPDGLDAFQKLLF